MKSKDAVSLLSRFFSTMGPSGSRKEPRRVLLQTQPDEACWYLKRAGVTLGVRTPTTGPGPVGSCWLDWKIVRALLLRSPRLPVTDLGAVPVDGRRRLVFGPITCCPAMPPIDEDWSVVAPGPSREAGLFLQRLRDFSWIPDADRPYLDHVSIEADCVVATNGHWLWKVPSPFPHPRKPTNRQARLLGKLPVDNTILRVRDSGISVAGDDWQCDFEFNVVSDFPDWRAVSNEVEKERSRVFLELRRPWLVEFLDCVRRCSDRELTVEFRWQPDGTWTARTSSGDGSSMGSVPPSFVIEEPADVVSSDVSGYVPPGGVLPGDSPELFQIGFASPYLARACQLFRKSPTLKFQMRDELSPAWIHGEDDGRELLIMPRRIQ